MRSGPSLRRALVGAVVCGAGVAAAAPGVGSAAPPPPVAVTEGDFAPRLAAAFNAFYPKRVTVEQGGSVRFSIVGFHTVIFPRKGTRLAALIAPTGGLNPARSDPAGAPYWWVGQSALNFNPAVAAPSGGTAVTGAKTVSSGLLQGNAPTFTVTFPKAGTYEVRCGVHPRMRGAVRVLRSGSGAVPAPAAAARAARGQKQADLRRARSLVRSSRAAQAGTGVLIGPARGGAELLSFFPKLRSVAAGTDVTFRMRGVNEFHTVTFGPKAYVDGVEQAFQRSLDAEGTFPSDLPGAVPAITPASHGNGFLNSGLLASPGLTGAPTSFTVRFSTPGVYIYRCILHPGMTGRVAVT